MAKPITRPTLDEVLRPMKMTCANCGGEMTAYPCPTSEGGIGYCSCTSPAWLESFAQYLMNEERKKHGLEPI